LTRTLCSALLIACALSACGKKGPPLAPVSHIPAAIDKLTINHVGADMYVSLTVPPKNIDGTMPADVGRIDVYGLTSARPPSPTQFLQVGERVATVPVARPPRKGETPQPTNEPEQGGTITIHDGLSAAERVPRALPTVPGRTPSSTPAASVPPEVAAEEAPVPQRYYMALAFSER
jgi:hypothetical protein